MSFPLPSSQSLLSSTVWGAIFDCVDNTSDVVRLACVSKHFHAIATARLERLRHPPPYFDISRIKMDVWDCLLNYLDDPKDLAHLSRVSRRLHYVAHTRGDLWVRRPAVKDLSALPVPEEVWDAVAHWVSDTADLFSLALVCKRSFSCVIPSHLYYRNVATTFDNVALWNELQVSRRRASAMQRLLLHGHLERTAASWRRRDEFIVKHGEGMHWVFPPKVLRASEDSVDFDPNDPFGFGSPGTPVEGPPSWLDSLDRGASSMRNLKHLCLQLPWTHLLYLASFFRVLSPYLEALHIEVGWHREIGNEKYEGLAQTIRSLRGGYKSFSWMSRNGDISPESCVSLFDEIALLLVSRCPELDDLAIVLPERAGNNPFAKLWKGRWPLLKALQLGGVKCSEDTEFALFCKHHPGLRQLEIRTRGDRALPALQDDVLPLLANADIAENDLVFSRSLFGPVRQQAVVSTYRPIKSLTLELRENIKSSPNCFERLGDLCFDARSAGCLRKLSISMGTFEKRQTRLLSWLKLIGVMVPSIRELVVQPKGVNESYSAWVLAVSRFANLEILSGTQKTGFMGTFMSKTGRVALLQEMGGHCPHLRKVDDWICVEDHTGRSWLKDTAAA